MLKPLLVVASLAAQYIPATANYCYPTSEFVERLAHGDAIFVGVAKDIVELAEYFPEGPAVRRRVFYFSVIKAEKKSNIQQAFLTVTEFAVGGCGTLLPYVGIGDTVLVYARSDKKEGVYGMCDTPFSILSKPIQFEHGTQVCFPGYLKEEIAFLGDSSRWYTPKGDSNPSPLFGTAKKLTTSNWNSEPEASQTAPKKNATGTSWLYIVLASSLLLNLLFLFQSLKKVKK